MDSSADTTPSTTGNITAIDSARQTSGTALPPPKSRSVGGARRAPGTSASKRSSDDQATKPTRDAVDANGNRIISVAQASNVKLVAGSIAHTSRETNPPTLQAIGPASTNQAIKAIAIARTYVEENKLDFVVVPARIQTGDIKYLVQLRLQKKDLQEEVDTAFVELKTASTTGSGALAGAIANNIREGRQVRITAIGAPPVFRAIDAIIKSNEYLEKDNISICFQPSFATITTSEGKRINSVQLTILSQKN